LRHLWVVFGGVCARGGGSRWVQVQPLRSWTS
jgi:hypothetical protein